MKDQEALVIYTSWPKIQGNIAKTGMSFLSNHIMYILCFRHMAFNNNRRASHGVPLMTTPKRARLVSTHSMTTMRYSV